MAVTELTQSRETKALSVYRELRRRIVDLEYRPGEGIKKEELTAEFEVSRAPVNDALARLRDEGLVVIAPQHGTFVAEMTVDLLNEGMFARRALEPEAARRAAVADDKEAFLQVLEDNMTKQRACAAAGDASGLYALDDIFHSMILSHLRFHRTVGLIGAFSAQLERARNLSPNTRRSLEATIEEHEQIVRSIASGDANWAASAMDAHLASALLILENAAYPILTDALREEDKDEGSSKQQSRSGDSQ